LQFFEARSEFLKRDRNVVPEILPATAGITARVAGSGREPLPVAAIKSASIGKAGGGSAVRKLIAFDDDTFDKLKQLGRDRMATIQELADEAFADMLRKHGIPIDLKDALRKSVSQSKAPAKKATKLSPARKPKS
jgi:hypothetical protein